MNEREILIVQEEKGIHPAVKKALAPFEYELIGAPIKNLAATISSSTPGCAVVVVEDGGRRKIETLLETIKAVDDNIPILVVADSHSLEDAIAIMKAGAFDYFVLPLDEGRFAHTIANAIRLYSLTKRVFLLESQVGAREKFGDMVGQSPRMQEVFNMIEMVAKSNATVLIQGESGTGKELVAKAIHQYSPRSEETFLDINCGAIPRELLENEMFGHERGAFTGADRRYTGSIERANEGTLFLDEISEMDASLQVKLLRFLQERTLTRVGGSQPITVDVRIVAATNRNLLKEVEAGKFREDLFYRLNVVPITIPPLRDRAEDIPLLARHFLEKYASRNEKIFLDFSPQSLEKMVAYDWPGNVRELENAIERIAVLHNDTRVKPAHLPPQVLENKGKIRNVPESFQELGGVKILPLELVERYAIEAAIERCLGNVNEAAGKLKIGQATLYRKLKQYGLRS